MIHCILISNTFFNVTTYYISNSDVALNIYRVGHK